jgi:hypothetical protein
MKLTTQLHLLSRLRVRENLPRNPFYAFRVQSLPQGKLVSKIQNLLILGLFNDAVSSSDYIASNDNMINEQSMGKDMEGKGSGLI